MKAVVYTQYGPPEVLHIQEVPKPVAKANEILVKVHAATVNRTDCGFRRPEYPVIIRPMHGLIRPKTTILGNEFSGVVESVGQDVKSFKPGDAVFGLSTKMFGAHAEYICLPESGSVVLKPSNMSFPEAAAVCDGLMLGMNLVRSIDFQSPKQILVNGATGSIGSACVQLARHFGGKVTAVCDTKNLDFVKSLGADRVIDYTQVDFTQDTQKFDVVLDAVGKSSYFRCKRLLNPTGVYISTELGFLAQNIYLPLLGVLFGGRKVKFPIPTNSKADMLQFKEIIEAGHYKAVIDRSYHFDQIVEAVKFVETGMKTGNVVLTWE